MPDVTVLIFFQTLTVN